MYINNIDIRDFRTFKKTAIEFIHPDQDFAAMGVPRPRIPNVNLLLGNNGAGKTTLLKAIAIAALWPAVTAASLPLYRLIRRAADADENSIASTEAVIRAAFKMHGQDQESVTSWISEAQQGEKWLVKKKMHTSNPQ